MAIEVFRRNRLSADRMIGIQQAQDILAEYPGQRLTARQVYYQFVSRGWLANIPKNYKKLTALLTDARYAGEIDWGAIEDRGREPDSPSEWASVDSLVESALRAYKLPRLAGQTAYVELWVEKQALAGVLAPIARQFHATLMVNKGYSSASAMKESADRYLAAIFEDQDYVTEWKSRMHDAGGEEELEDELRGEFKDMQDKEPILFYLGDHDPSGEDMVRDVRDRLCEFGVLGLKVEKLALNMDQIRRFNPPPNPAKITDSRAAAYIEKFGDESWELDALPPRELRRLVESSFESVLDMDLMNQVIAQEEKDKKLLRAAIKKGMG